MSKRGTVPFHFKKSLRGKVWRRLCEQDMFWWGTVSLPNGTPPAFLYKLTLIDGWLLIDGRYRLDDIPPCFDTCLRVWGLFMLELCCQTDMARWGVINSNSLKTEIVLRDCCLHGGRFQAPRDPHVAHSRSGIYVFPFGLHVWRLTGEGLQRLYIMISDRSNQSWQSVRGTVINWNVRWVLGGLCGFQAAPSLSNFLVFVGVTRLRKMKTDAISTNVWFQPSGVSSAVFSLKSD